MEVVNKKYYDGFEGEPEIQFIYKKGNDTEILIVWEGYFDQIMRLIILEFTVVDGGILLAIVVYSN